MFACLCLYLSVFVYLGVSLSVCVCVCVCLCVCRCDRSCCFSRTVDVHFDRRLSTSVSFSSICSFLQTIPKLNQQFLPPMHSSIHSSVQPPTHPVSRFISYYLSSS